MEQALRMQEEAETKSFYAVSKPIQFQEIIIKGKKKYVISGYISTKSIDGVNDLVTEDCLQDMDLQIKEGIIALKFDKDHETIIEENLGLNPRGKILESNVDAKGLWVKAEINPHHKEFNELWGSIKDGYLDAFSITFKPIEAMTQWVGNKSIRVLSKVKLINVGITGNPINEECKIENVVAKALMGMNNPLDHTSHSSKSKEEVENTAKMEEEKKTEAEQEDNSEEGTKSDESSESNETEAKSNLEADVTKLKAQVKELKKKLSEKEEEAKKYKADSDKEDDGDSKESKSGESELKSEIKSLQAEVSKLSKSLEKPVMKGLIGSQPQLNEKVATPIELIR